MWFNCQCQRPANRATKTRRTNQVLTGFPSNDPLLKNCPRTTLAQPSLIHALRTKSNQAASLIARIWFGAAVASIGWPSNNEKGSIGGNFGWGPDFFQILQIAPPLRNDAGALIVGRIWPNCDTCCTPMVWCIYWCQEVGVQPWDGVKRRAIMVGSCWPKKLTCLSGPGTLVEPGTSSTVGLERPFKLVQA